MSKHHERIVPDRNDLAATPLEISPTGEVLNGDPAYFYQYATTDQNFQHPNHVSRMLRNGHELVTDQNDPALRVMGRQDQGGPIDSAVHYGSLVLVRKRKELAAKYDADIEAECVARDQTLRRSSTRVGSTVVSDATLGGISAGRNEALAQALGKDV